MVLTNATKSTKQTTAWTASARFAAGCGVSNGITGWYSKLGWFSDMPSWKLW